MKWLAMSRFRMTAQIPEFWWRLPDYELKPHLVGFPPAEEVRQEGWELWSTGERSNPIRYRLPDPLLPHLLDVNLDSEEDILQLVRTYGPLGISRRDLDQGLMTNVRHRPEDFDGTGIRGHTQEFAEAVQVADQQAAIAVLLRAQAIAAELVNDAFNVRALRGLQDPWIYSEPPANKKAAQDQLQKIINTGLSGFELRYVGRELSLEPPLSLFALACLELVDAVGKGLPWRRCALDGCRQLFQPKRRDKIFHDEGCSRVSASRNYRLRQRTGDGKGLGAG